MHPYLVWCLAVYSICYNIYNCAMHYAINMSMNGHQKKCQSLPLLLLHYFTSNDYKQLQVEYFFKNLIRFLFSPSQENEKIKCSILLCIFVMQIFSLMRGNHLLL